MTLSITPVAILANQTVAANSQVLSGVTVDGGNLVALGIIAELTFNASATAGARIIVRAVPDGTGTYAPAVQSVDVALGAPGVAFSVLPGHKTYEVGVINDDATYSITAVTIEAEPQRLT